jgi:lysozyme family protein
MYRFFKFILGTGLVVISLWSCSLDHATPVLPINAADPIPLAKEFYTQEKPKQVSSSFRIQTEQEIFPFWAGAKKHAGGRMLIVPAHRKVQVRYEAGYLRRFVFELDGRGQVIRGGMLELSGKELEFLFRNEVLLVEGFLAGVKSKDLTYLWSDFVARPLDGTQADGRVVTLQREGGGKSRQDAEALRTEFCIDWYWVYSSNGVVVYEVYSHTTCGSASCDSNAHDACLDDGTGGGGEADCNSFEDRVNHVLNSEGGFVNDPIDRGGPTNRGISWDVWVENAQSILGKQPTLSNLENLSADDAKTIYKVKFWDKIYLDDIEDGDLRWLLFDFYVNSGGNAIIVLQKELNKMGHSLSIDGVMGPNTINAINSSNIIGLYNNFKEGRRTFYEKLVQKDIDRYLKKHPGANENELRYNTQLRFKNGWINRVNAFIEKTIQNLNNVNC